MAVIRLDNEERRRRIVDAAVPLFARKGFAGTTTKEIAEAALVSEALVFKHFPSKAALYEEILGLGCRGDPGLEHFSALEPSTSALIEIVHGMMRHFVLGESSPVPPGESASEDKDTRHRLMVNSFLEDGEYARLVFEWVVARIYPKIGECLSAAQAAGDLVEMPIPFENRFWFGQHVAAMICYLRLPGRSTVTYVGDTDAVIAQAVRFVLRGFGVKDEVLAAYCATAPACSGTARRAVGETALHPTEASGG
jgi:AcrR family transcriptional regulator